MEKVENMIEELHRGICTVTFKKVNGETRTMKCTLHPNYLPEQQTLNEKTQTKDPMELRIPGCGTQRKTQWD